jgi:hypothetical protein
MPVCLTPSIASLTRASTGRIEKGDLLSAISRASDTEAIYTVR